MKRKTMLFMILIGLGVLVGSLLVYKARKSGAQRAAENATFVVGTVAGYAPFSSVNAEGELEGFDIDVAKALAQKMGKEVEIKDLGSMASLFIALEQGSIDAIMWALSITSDRLERVAMVRYAGEDTVSYPLIFWQKLPAGIASIQDMQGMSVCVEPASSQDAVLGKYTFITKIATERVDDALLSLQYNKADAAFVEPAIAKKFKAKYPEVQILDVALAPEDQALGMGIAIKKDNLPLIKQVQKAVDKLQRAGTLQAYADTWKIS